MLIIPVEAADRVNITYEKIGVHGPLTNTADLRTSEESLVSYGESTVIFDNGCGGKVAIGANTILVI